MRALRDGHRTFVERAAAPPLRAAVPKLDEESQRTFDALGYTGDEEE